MDSDGQLDLYDQLAARLKQAHRKVRAMQVPESERVAFNRRLLAVTASSKHDLATAARRLDRLMEELDRADPGDGRFPSA